MISALGDEKKKKETTFVPYRDSKLTRLLQVKFEREKACQKGGKVRWNMEILGEGKWRKLEDYGALMLRW